MTGLWSALLCLGVLAIAGCEPSDQTAGAGGDAPEAVIRRAENGPVTLSLRADRTDLPFTEQVELVVEATSEPGVTVEIDNFAEALGDRPFEYRVVQSDSASPPPGKAGLVVHSQRVVLEFFLPGEYELPSAKLRFIDDRETPDPSALPEDLSLEDLETETITITARTTAAAEIDAEALTQIQTLPPLELAADPFSFRRLWWVWPLLIGLIVLAVILIRWRRRQGEAAAVPVIPAHEWARARLKKLLADDLLAKGQVQPFYYRLSDILRGYIERRFAVAAAEMTTEEFLSAMSVDYRFSDEYRSYLQRFMTECDLVKFALHQPNSTESDGAFRAADEFVEHTKERGDLESASAPPGAQRRELVA